MSVNVFLCFVACSFCESIVYFTNVGYYIKKDETKLLIVLFTSTRLSLNVWQKEQSSYNYKFNFIC